MGPVLKVDEHSLPKRPNLHWLGKKDYSELPALCGGFDVCLMPFAANAVHYATIVRDKATLRSLIHASTAIAAVRASTAMRAVHTLERCNQTAWNGRSTRVAKAANAA